MLTSRKATRVLEPGDYVYVSARQTIRRTRVVAVEPLGVDTEFDFLPYDEHRESWWLTRGEAETSLAKENRPN